MAPSEFIIAERQREQRCVADQTLEEIVEFKPGAVSSHDALQHERLQGAVCFNHVPELVQGVITELEPDLQLLQGSVQFERFAQFGGVPTIPKGEGTCNFLSIANHVEKR